MLKCCAKSMYILCVSFTVFAETTVMWNESWSSLLSAHKSICIDTQMESVYTLCG